MPNSLSRRGTAMLAIGLAASLGVAACGSSKKSGGSAGGGKNYKMTLIAGVKGVSPFSSAPFAFARFQ